MEQLRFNRFEHRSYLQSLRITLAVFCLVTASLYFRTASAATTPECPTDLTAPYPAYSNVDEPPVVTTWRNIKSLPDSCRFPLGKNPASLTIALAGQFSFAGTIEEISERIGAVSTTKGIRYWSVSDAAWRSMVSDAYALNSLNIKDKRPDFLAKEILSGEPLYFAQNDTRSWGVNIYRLKALSSTADQLIFESRNETPVRFGPITVFRKRAVQSVLFIRKAAESTWQYYGLTVVKDSALPIDKKSLINRQAALYRLLTGTALEKEPPLAP